MAYVLMTAQVPGWSSDWDIGKTVTVNDAQANALVTAGVGMLVSNPPDPQPPQTLSALAAILADAPVSKPSTPGQVYINGELLAIS